MPEQRDVKGRVYGFVDWGQLKLIGLITSAGDHWEGAYESGLQFGRTWKSEVLSRQEDVVPYCKRFRFDMLVMVAFLCSLCSMHCLLCLLDHVLNMLFEFICICLRVCYVLTRLHDQINGQLHVGAIH